MEKCWYGAAVLPNQASFVIVVTTCSPRSTNLLTRSGKDDLVADDRAELDLVCAARFPSGTVMIVYSFPGFEIADGLHHFLDKKQHVFERHIFAERNQVDFVVPGKYPALS